MANHKRKGPKSTRAGCLLCKPHKRQGVDAPTRQEQRGRDKEALFLGWSDEEAKALRQEIDDMMMEEAEEVEFAKKWHADEKS